MKGRVDGRRARGTLILGMLLLAVAGTIAPLAAQEIRLTPFYGYRAFGELRDFDGDRVDIDDAGSFGALVGVVIRPGVVAEVGFSRQNTDATLGSPFQGIERLSVNVDQWAFGVSREFRPAGPDSNLSAFTGGLVGLTIGTSDTGNGSDTNFMLGANGGVNLRPARSPLGVRLEARGYFAFAGSSSVGIGCGAYSGCSVGVGSQGVFQLDLLAGITLALGGRR